jgi:hypothetical protein
MEIAIENGLRRYLRDNSEGTRVKITNASAKVRYAKDNLPFLYACART